MVCLPAGARATISYYGRVGALGCFRLRGPLIAYAVALDTYLTATGLYFQPFVNYRITKAEKLPSCRELHLRPSLLLKRFYLCFVRVGNNTVHSQHWHHIETVLQEAMSGLRCLLSRPLIHKNYTDSLRIFRSSVTWVSILSPSARSSPVST